MILIRSSLPSSNPVTLPDAVCIVSGPEQKTEKYRKSPKVSTLAGHHSPSTWGATVANLRFFEIGEARLRSSRKKTSPGKVLFFFG